MPRSTAASRSNVRTTNSTTSRPITGRSRSRTAPPSTSHGYFGNDIICAISEARGISPTIGLAFVNLSTCEAVLCQFTDTQTFARTCHKIKVFSPTEILFAPPAAKSKLLSIVEENLEASKDEIAMTEIDRRYWSETIGHEYIRELAFPEDLAALKLSLAGNYFAVCCFAAVLRFIDLGLSQTFAAQSLRIKFESSEGTMMIDLSTIANLELVQNLQNAKSKHCLYGVLNQTSTRMGARLLKNNILQPSTDRPKIEQRWEVVNELSSKEDVFFPLRDALKDFVDTDRALANLVLMPKRLDFQYMEQSVNNVLMLKSFVDSIKPVWQILAGTSSPELLKIQQLCDPENWAEVQALIEYAISPDVSYSQSTTDLRNHRVFAIRAGTNGFLDVVRQSYNEFVGDAKDLVDQLQVEHELALELKYDTSRQFYIKTPVSELDSSASLPGPFINVVKRGKHLECQTISLIKLNQKIKDVHDEIIAMSDSSIQTLIASVRTKLHPLFKISESLALLDVLTAFAHLVTTNSYVRPEVSADVLAIKSARHPIRENIQIEKYVPNDVYATKAHKRFQIITGCNMSGKSTYIRCIALITVMAQIGSFVPAEYASFPIAHSLFARISTDSCVEANVSTFASEMREIAFILRNIEPRSLVIVDELGRGTSTTDGLAIAIAVSEALIQSKAHVWFVTHFRDLPRVLAERVGAYNMYMHVDITSDFSTMMMRYKVSEGREQQKYYGLALAQLVDLPDELMRIAVAASQELNAICDAKKRNAKLIALAKRRKLAAHLRETLIQARDGNLQGVDLLAKMKRLQEEFCVRMLAIEAEYVAAQNDQVKVDVVSEKGDDAAQQSTSAPNPMNTTSEINQDQSTPQYAAGIPTPMHDFHEEQVQRESRERITANSYSEEQDHLTDPTWSTTPSKKHHDSSKTTLHYENPIFRPMPTSPSPLTSRKDSKSGGSGYSLTQLKRMGNEVSDPIYIDDDGGGSSSVSSNGMD